MKVVRIIAACVIALIADVVFNRVLSFGTPVFDPFLILVVYYATISKPMGSMFIGATAGAVQDVWQELIFGLNGFKKTLIAYLIATLSSIFDLTSIGARFIILIVATVIDSLIEAGLMIAVGRSVTYGLFYTMGLKIIGNAIFGTIVFMLTAKFARKSYSEVL